MQLMNGSIIKQVPIPTEAGAFTLQVPRGACCLHVARVDDRFVMWVAYDLKYAEDKVVSQFFLCPDGEVVPSAVADHAAPLGSFVTASGHALHLAVLYEKSWALSAMIGKAIAPEDAEEPQMDAVTLNFNVDIGKLRELGIDPTTSEGKLRLRQMFLDGLGHALDASVGDDPDEMQWDEIMELFRSE